MKMPLKINRLWKISVIAGILLLLGASVLILPQLKTFAQKKETPGIYLPVQKPVAVFSSVNVRELDQQDKLNQPEPASWLNVIPVPKGTPPVKSGTNIILPPDVKQKGEKGSQIAPVPSTTGTSPGPFKTFQGEYLSGTSIPPDTMGAVGLNHTVAVSNNMMRITDRNGIQLTRMTLNAFWAGTTIKGTPVTSTFDPKVLYDRFNDRYIMISSSGAQSVNSGALFAVSQTGDPTGTWNRITVAADPTSTAGGGLWIDYPSIGFNKNWIVVNYNTFGYGTAGGGYLRSDIDVIDKQAFYSNTLMTVNSFQGLTSDCVAPFETKLGCGFTMSPAIVEDNTTNTVHIVEDWASTDGQLRLSKITGTAAAPVLTVGTQFPQSTLSWRFNASRIGTTGGYAPQRQQSANLPSGTRIMTNDSRIQNTVYRNGSLWTTHTVMVAAAPTAAGTGYGAANPDIRSAIQWWQINPTIETGLSTPPLQRSRIEDPIADNCHNGSAGTRTTGLCIATGNQVGQFFAFPNISVNLNNDAFIGFTQFSALTYPSAAYALRLSGDPINTMRDSVVYRPGQSNYNLGSGTGTTRQNRWGDYSASQVDPVNDTDFWTIQEYSGTYRDFGIGLAAPWETYWANIKPSAVAPLKTGSLIISEFRLRGPQGIRDEFVELYNPGTSPIIVNTTDNSDGWALAYSANGTTGTGIAVIPNGTVIPARGHFLIADNPDGTNGPTVTYSLFNYVSNKVRTAENDTGWSLDLADNGGLAIFKTSTTANFNSTTLMDSAGFSGIAAGLFREGNGIAPITAVTPTGQISFLRNLAAGTPQDTNLNENDFILVNPNAPTEALGVSPMLGAAGPENLSSPVTYNAQIPVTLVDSTVSAASPPNQVYDPTATGTNATNGKVSVRRSVVNNTGKSISQLRFRVASLSTFPNALDFRLLSSPAISITTSDVAVCGSAPTPCAVPGYALVLEEPPTQSNGGGVNSSVNVLAITFNTPMLPNARINLNLLFGVVSGTPLTKLAPDAAVPFSINAEAILQDPLAPTASSVTVSGRVVTATGRGVSNVLVTLTNLNGEVLSVKSNSFGYYSIEGVLAGETYVIKAAFKQYSSAPQVVQIFDEVGNMDLVVREQ